MRLFAVALAMAPAVFTTSPAAAQGADPAGEPWAVPRMTGPIELDGRVDEPAWEAIDPLPVTQHVPNFRGEPTERTEFRVGYDDQYVYFSCRAYDSDPAGIRTPSLRRDDGSFANDICAISLDTFNDKETATGFGTTPAGLRTDVVFPDDATGAPNFSWDTFWDAAVSRDDRGWYAEIRIPLSSLRFQELPGEDRVAMGLSVFRLIARKSEMHVWPAISPQWGQTSAFKASQFREVTFQGIERARPVYVTPYALGGAGRSQALNAGGTAYEASTETVRDLGLDLKYGLAANLTLDVTVNTDFAQVEADEQQVNLTRFSLFFPEKRLFFQERAGIFGFSLGGVDRLFHSRRIGIVGGEQVPIYGGVRVVGRVADWDVGVLDMQTAATDLSPSENMGVVRFRRRVLNENSYVGAILTTRVAEAGGGRNIVYGVDALIRMFGQDYLTVNVAQSFDDDGTTPSASVPAVDRSLARVSWQRRGQDGIGYGLDMTRAGPAFEPGLGFLRRRDYTSAAGSVAYGWRPDEDSPVLTHGPTLEASAFTRNDDGVVETFRLEPRWALVLKSGHELTASISATYENLAEGFSLPGGSVPADEHRFATAGVSYSPSGGAPLRLSARVEAGGFYDGRIVSAGVSPTWNVSRHLELGGSYGMDAVRFPARDEAFTAHVARLRSRLMFSTEVSVSAFVQYSSTGDRLSANVRFRYNPAEGHDLYMVWNEGLHTDRHALDPTPPVSERRTLLLKYSRTFTFGL